MAKKLYSCMRESCVNMISRRKFCSIDCAALDKTKKRHHPCELSSCSNETTNERFCSVSCANMHSSRRTKENYNSCLNCFNSLSNSYSKFCNQTCNQAYRNKVYIDGWLAGLESGTTPSGYLSERVINYIRSLKGEKCWECGWACINPSTGKIPVQIDHIDGNALNNAKENLRLICPNCHSLTPTFGNIGSRKSSRISRYKKQ